MPFPPYGKKIYQLRLRGEHPDNVTVIFAAKWVRYDDRPFIYMPAGDYKKGAYDFSLLAGLIVNIWFVDWPGDDGYLLVSEIGVFASCVVVHFIKQDCSEYVGKAPAKIPISAWHDLHLPEFLRDHSSSNGWLGNWSDQLNLDYDRRKDREFEFRFAFEVSDG